MFPFFGFFYDTPTPVLHPSLPLLSRLGALPISQLETGLLGDRLVDLQQVARQRREIERGKAQAVEARLGLGDVDERLEGAQDGLPLAGRLLPRLPIARGLLVSAQRPLARPLLAPPRAPQVVRQALGDPAHPPPP